MEISIGSLILDIIIAIIFYMSIPFFMFFRNDKKYDNKKKKKVILLNSIFVTIVFVIIRAFLNFTNPVGSFVPALFYYYINKWIWVKNKDNQSVLEKEPKTKKEEKEDSDIIDNNYSMKDIGIFVSVVVVLIIVTVLLVLLLK